MSSDVILSGALFISQALFLAILPWALFAAGTRLINNIQDARLPWTPHVELFAMLVGVLAGVVVLTENVEATTIGASAIFLKGGPWDLSFGEFLSLVANPLAYDLSSILPVPFLGDYPSPAGLVVLLLSGLAIYAPIVVFRSRRAVANGVRNAVIIIFGAYLAIYGFGFVLWLMNKLNFGIYLLLMILIHQRRRSDRIVLKLN